MYLMSIILSEKQTFCIIFLLLLFVKRNKNLVRTNYKIKYLTRLFKNKKMYFTKKNITQ